MGEQVHWPVLHMVIVINIIIGNFFIGSLCIDPLLYSINCYKKYHCYCAADSHYFKDHINSDELDYHKNCVSSDLSDYNTHCTIPGKLQHSCLHRLILWYVKLSPITTSICIHVCLIGQK